MRFEELLGDVEVLELRGDPGVDVSAIVHDSRSAGSGACFACIPGAVTDGHDHAPAAVRSGAVALLVERPLDVGVSEARVRSVREALGPTAARLHGYPSRDDALPRSDGHQRQDHGDPPARGDRGRGG